jgi:predicted phage terminase large subunit-like protein
MAWINGKWISYRDRDDMIAVLNNDLNEVSEKLDKAFAKDPSSAETAELYQELTSVERNLTRLQRIHRGETDLLYFAYAYFGEDMNPGNGGNWIPKFGFDPSVYTPDEFDKACEELKNNAPGFHHDICAIMDNVSNVEKNAKVCVAAPRSHAKSSFLSKAFVLHEVVYRKREYVIIISETPAVSTGNLEWLALQLKSNAMLRQDFGPLLSPKQQENPKDNSSEFIAWEPTGDNGEKRLIAKVEAASTGQALRGRNFLGRRPDLIVCDDLESTKNTNTEQLREEMANWFAQVVVPLGDPAGKRTAFVVMGTTVHPQSLLLRIINERSDFKSKVFRAIIEWPERMDLWDACKLVYTDRENPNRAQEAYDMYLANEVEMLRGAVVLWPEVQPLWKLMAWRWDNGTKAFNTEYQNNPIDEDSIIFNPDKFRYWDIDNPNRDFLNGDYSIHMGIDFALGKERGDFSAITTVARHKENGGIYVIDSYVERAHPDIFLKVIVDKVRRYQPDNIAAEAQAAQEFFVHKLKEALASDGYPAHRRVKEVKQRSRKEMRIESMLPDIENGTIQFCRRHSMLLEQFELYGSGTHDDAPDSMQMAVSIAGEQRKKIYNKPSWL